MFDPTGVWTHDLQIMTVHFMSLGRLSPGLRKGLWVSCMTILFSFFAYNYLNSHKAIKPQVKGAVNLMIENDHIDLPRRLCGYVWLNILTLSSCPSGETNTERELEMFNNTWSWEGNLVSWKTYQLVYLQLSYQTQGWCKLDSQLGDNRWSFTSHTPNILIQWMCL